MIERERMKARWRNENKTCWTMREAMRGNCLPSWEVWSAGSIVSAPCSAPSYTGAVPLPAKPYQDRPDDLYTPLIDYTRRWTATNTIHDRRTSPITVNIDTTILLLLITIVHRSSQCINTLYWWLLETGEPKGARTETMICKHFGWLSVSRWHVGCRLSDQYVCSDFPPN